MCVDVDGYKIINVYKPPPIRLLVSDLPVFSFPCLYAGDFNCQHVDWGYDANSADGEYLVGWARTNNLALLHNPKNAASFHSGRCNTNTNPDLAFVSTDLDSHLPDRHVLEKFPRSQHRPSLITQVCSFCTKQACKAWFFNGGDIAPQWAILTIRGAFVTFSEFGGRFIFLGGDFRRDKYS